MDRITIVEYCNISIKREQYEKRERRNCSLLLTVYEIVGSSMNNMQKVIVLKSIIESKKNNKN